MRALAGSRLHGRAPRRLAATRLAPDCVLMNESTSRRTPPTPPPPLPPRVLLVMPDQWPRALLRAALRDAGYDAVGAPGLSAALRYRPAVADRGPVRLVV